MSATFDTTTKTAYDAATTAAARATAIVASLSSGGSPEGAVLVKVYNGASPDAEMGSGTMTAPWATASGGTVVIGEVSSFTVGTTGTPDANWYIKFRTLDGTRWVRASFGLVGSGQDFTWSLATFTAGQTGTIGTATIVCTGNAVPVFTVAPTTASIAATGGTIQFTATDPDGGTILYSLTTTRSGITINSTTGLVTVTAAAAGTSGNIVVQASDGILTAPATCAVTVATAQAVKWYPGHYGQANAHITPPKYAQYVSEINEVANVPANRMVGFSLLGVWGQVESTKNVYNWTKIREYRDQVVAQGKRVYLDWMFGCYGYGSTLNTTYFPQWAISEGLVGYSGSQQFLKFYRAAAMDRMILFYQAMAAEFENDEWVVMVATPETSHGIVAGDADCTAANALIQWKRFVDACKIAFLRTPVIIQNNFLFNQSTSSEFSQYCIDNGMGLGGPDLILVPEEGSLNPDGWLAMYIKGWRYSGSAWVEGVAADQTSKIAYSLGQQVIRSTASTPQKYYEEGRDFYNVTHIVWAIKYEGWLWYDYVTRVPAMDWPNVESYLAAADRPLRTALPTNLGGA